MQRVSGMLYSIKAILKILQFFFRQNEKPSQRPPENVDKSSMADLVRLLEVHAPKKKVR
jgi:hypothetical protein